MENCFLNVFLYLYIPFINWKVKFSIGKTKENQQKKKQKYNTVV